MRIFYFLIGTIFLAPACGLASVVVSSTPDVGVTLTASTSTGLQPGQPIDMTLTAMNNGPGAVDFASLSTPLFTDEFYIASEDASTCSFLRLDEGNGYDLEWFAHGPGGSALGVGEAAVCHFQIALTDNAPPTYDFGFSLRPGDPVPENDSAVVTLQRGPPVPSLSDLEVALSASPTDAVLPGAPVDVVVSVTNHGPSPLPYVLVSTNEFLFAELQPGSYNFDECGPLILKQDRATREYQMEFFLAGPVDDLTGQDGRPIAVGETLSCHLQITLTRDAPVPFSFGFALPDSFNDPNADNDGAFVSLTLGAAYAPTPIPALSFAVLCLFAGGQVLIAGLAIRGRRRWDDSTSTSV